jgi:hypothetical protein
MSPTCESSATRTRCPDTEADELPEHRIEITIPAYGHDPDNGPRFLESFMRLHPEVGPSVSQNTTSGTLSVTFSLDADDANEAFDLARPIFNESASGTGLMPRKVINVEVSLIPAEEYEDIEEPEAVPA